MKNTELINRLKNYPEDYDVEVCVDVGTEDNPYLRVRGDVQDLNPGAIAQFCYATKMIGL